MSLYPYINTTFRNTIWNLKDRFRKITFKYSKLAEEYLKKNDDKQLAARHMANVQIKDCAVTGFITSFGGLITLPLNVSADLSATWFIQLRMIAAIAVMAGLNPTDNEIKVMCKACLLGKSGIELIKRAGVELTKRAGYKAVGKIPGKLITAINQRVGMRLLTKFGNEGIINLGKGVPILGGVVGATFDYLSTARAANTAIKYFLQNI